MTAVLAVMMTLLVAPPAEAWAVSRHAAADQNWDPPHTPLGAQTKSVKGKNLTPGRLPGPAYPVPRNWNPGSVPPFVAAGSADVVLGVDSPGAAAARAASGGASPASGGGTPVHAGKLPVTVAPRVGGGGAGSHVHVEVADQAKSQAAHVLGRVVALTDTDSGAGASGGHGVTVALDLKVLQQGAMWVDRARLVALPACVLTTPDRAECQKQTPVASTVDAVSGILTADVTLPAAPSTAISNSATPSAHNSSLHGTTGGAVQAGFVQATAATAAPMVLAATSSPSGPSGSYAATPLSPSMAWGAGSNDGNFTYSYPIQVPPTLGGQAPSVALSYDSSAVDGKNSAQNSQSSWIGDGWSYEPGFIERSYKSCDKDGITGSGDLCWGGQNATLSLAGHSGALVRDDTTGVWHFQGDDGSKVEQLTGAPNGLPTGEYWRITTTDGNQYYFGQNHLPGGDGTDPASNSAWAEPVYSPNSGDPCYSAATGQGSWCNMGWRWNLDYVVDTHQNLITYSYANEANYYNRGAGQNNGNGTLTAYTRGGYLTQIAYGQRLSEQVAAKGAVNPAAKILFNTVERCLQSGTITCDPSQRTAANALSWPDVPLDQVCGSSGTCTNYAPTFFTTKRLADSFDGQTAAITTQVLVGSSYTTVDTWTLSQSLPDPGDGTAKTLWLDFIKRHGTDGQADAPLPPVTFTARELANRVDGLVPAASQFNRPRIQQISTETGGQINVVYTTATDQNHPGCSRTAGTMPSSEDGNTLACEPVKWLRSDITSPTLVTDWFNKYLVSAVTEQDAVTGTALIKSTNYTYNGDAAWHRNDADFTDPATRTWDDFRGYQSVTTTTGSAFPGEAPKTQQTVMYLRGMNGDITAGGTARSIQVANPLGGAAVTDDDWLAGSVLATQIYNQAGGQVVSMTGTTTSNDPQSTATHAQSGGMPPLVARSPASQTTKASKALLADGVTWRTTTTVSTTDPADRNRVWHVDDQGDGTAATPEICTTSSYATSTNPMLMSVLSEKRAIAGSCGTTATATNTVSDVRTIYDGKPFGQAGLLAEATSSQTLDHYDGSGNPVFVNTSGTTFDVYGRLQTSSTADGSAYDASGKLLSGPSVTPASARTDYTPAAGAVPTSVKVTNPLGWISTVTQDPGRGLALTTTDPNSRVTTQQYDGLGRLTAVWTPDRATSLSASIAYTYSINGTTAPSAVTTRTLRETSPGSTDFSWKTELYDGLGRVRQTQTTLPTGGAGRLIADTAYDSHGWPIKTSSPYYDNTTLPNSTIFTAQDSQIPAQTWTSYDGLGRVTTSAFMSFAQQQWTTTTAYPGAERTDVTPPQGGTPISTVTDARGRSVAQWQYRTPTATGKASDADVTTYTYTPAGQPATRVDSVGNTWTYGYDLRGRQISASDPDTGTSITAYDVNSRIASTTDAKGNTLAYAYDLLGRKTGTYTGSVSTANQLAGWTYDTLPNALGKPVSSTRYVNDASGLSAYSQAVTGYDAAYRPQGTTITIPSREKSLKGTYTTSNTYNPVLGTIASTTLPAVGGLPAETVGYNYTVTGNLISSGGNAPLVNRVIYDAYAHPIRTTIGALGTQVVSTQQYDDATGHIVNSWIDRQTGTTSVDQTGYTYNPAGKITSVSDIQDTTATDTQCYTYDYLGRLTQAWTDTGGTTTKPTGAWTDTSGASQGTGTSASVPGIGGCNNANGPATSQLSVGGPAPYWQSYGYDATGNRTSLTSRSFGTVTPVPAPSQITQVVSAGDGTQTWAVALTSGKIWSSLQNSDGSWATFSDITAQAGSLGTIDAISAAVSNGQLQVMAVAGGKIWHTIRRSDGTWQPWGDVFSVVGSLSQPSQLALTSTAAGLEVLTFSGGKLWHTVRHTDGTWQTQGWGDVYSVVGTLTGATQIAAASTGSGLEIGVSAGGKLWHTVRHTDGTWQTQGWGDVYSVTGALTGAATGQGQLALAGTTAGLDVVALANGKPWHVLRDSSGNWSTWSDITGAAGTVAAPQTVGAAGYNADLKLLVAGSGQLNYTRRNGTNQTWTTWSALNQNQTVVSDTATTTSQYPAPKTVNAATNGAPNTGGGTGGPHALLSTTTTSAAGTSTTGYQYDQLGNTTAVTDTSGTTNLTWNGEDKLDSVTKTGQSAGTSYLYDADGNQLIRYDPGKATLNLGADELTLDTTTTNGPMTDVRYYGAPGGITITRVTAPTGGGTLVYQAADPHGTNSAQITTDSTQTVTRRPTDPFGNPRGTQPDPTTWSGDKGFVGGTLDPSTGLTNLGAREYDPIHGRFLNPDPLFDAANPQQWNGYAYSNNNPVNGSDPSGLFCDGCDADNPGSAWADGHPGCTTDACYNHDGSVDYSVGGKKAATTKSNGAGSGGNDGSRDHYVAGIRIPTSQELAARGIYDYGNYQQQVRHWALNICQGTGGSDQVYSGFCAMADRAGFLDPQNTVASIAVYTILFCSLGPAACARAAISAVATATEGAADFYAGGSLTAGGAAAAKQAVEAFLGSSATKEVDAVAAACFTKNSFIAGTQVLLADGSTKSIDQIQVGDTVTATNPQTGQTAPKTVTAVIKTLDDQDFSDLTIQAGHGDHASPASSLAPEQKITTTWHHPFWDVTTLRWTDAADLHPGDRLRQPDGSTITVTSIRNYHQSAPTYNLTTAGFHTYYVVAGGAQILVHNSNGCGIGRELLGDESSRHILEGHAYPGLPGKTVFPKDWSDNDILDAVADVVTNPESTRVWKTGSEKYAERTLMTRKGDPAVQAITGTVRGVTIEVRYEPLTGTVLTAFPK